MKNYKDGWDGKLQMTQQGWDGQFVGRSIPSPTITDGDNTSASQAPQDSPDMPNDYPQMEGN